MKNTIVLLNLFLSSFLCAQVAIGKSTITNSSVSLEFGSDNKGLLLPWVTSASSVIGVVDGTLIYDSSDKKVKYLQAASWFSLSNANPDVLDVSLQDLLTENPDAKVAIGAKGSTDATPGVLVLTDQDRAMILPKVVSPHLNIINPAAGMLAYDTLKHQLAVFNGKEWSFWKP